jgi:hypothetical protein
VSARSNRGSPRTPSALRLCLVRAVPLEVTRGAAVLFNGYLLHASRRTGQKDTEVPSSTHNCNAWPLLPGASPAQQVSTTEIGSLGTRAVISLGTDPYADRGVLRPRDDVFVRPF